VGRCRSYKSGVGGILGLLAQKHAKDVFVPECKDGPSEGCNSFRFDAWAMKRSWAKPLTIIYEIKTSRSDFLQDSKWPNYLPYCNELYFACSHGLIAPSEVGEHAGLMWASKNFARLYTKKKVPWRDVEIPESLYRYILMSRVRIERQRFGRDPVDDRQYWAEWLKRKKGDRDLGHCVSRAIREEVVDKVDRVETEIRLLKKQNRELEDVKRLLQELDFDPEGLHYGLRRQVEQKIKAMEQVFPDSFVYELVGARNKLQMAINTIEEMKRGAQSEN